MFKPIFRPPPAASTPRICELILSYHCLDRSNDYPTPEPSFRNSVFKILILIKSQIELTKYTVLLKQHQHPISYSKSFILNIIWIITLWRREEQKSNNSGSELENIYWKDIVDQHVYSTHFGHYAIFVNCCIKPFYCSHNRITECDISNTIDSAIASVLLCKLIMERIWSNHGGLESKSTNSSHSHISRVPTLLSNNESDMLPLSFNVLIYQIYLKERSCVLYTFTLQLCHIFDVSFI